jgi:hypothetical protein
MKIPDMESLEEPRELDIEDSGSELCENCRTVVEKIREFESWAETTPGLGFRHREKICDVSYIFHVRRCDLCHFLVDTWPIRHWELDGVRYEPTGDVAIYAESATEHIAPEFSLTGTEQYCDTYLYSLKEAKDLGWTIGNGFYVAHENNCFLGTKSRPDTATGSDESRRNARIFQPKAIKPYIDYQQLRSWNTVCRTTCGMQHAWLNETPLYLLDCLERVVVSHTDAAFTTDQPEYVALSYVWGSTAAIHRPVEMKIPFAIPDECPKTIEHAITVVKEMGLQYLWVDMYCVSTDSHIKHSQIARMDLVYKSASFTIIAAFGDCADDGLPGVGSCLREPQLVYKIGNMAFSKSLHNWHGAVWNTTWNSRGWTYQEDILSDHKLIFTKFQVYFTCVSRSCFEETCELTEKARQLLTSATTSTESNGDPLLIPPTPVRESNFRKNDELKPHDEETLEMSRYEALDSFRSHVGKYTMRTLTYGTDALNAIQSILDAGADKEIYHLQGIPYVPLLEKKSHNFALGLSWEHNEETLNNTSRRRLGFPSWSWAAWEVKVRWLRTLQGASDVQFWYLDQETGEYCPMESMSKLLDYPHPVRLQIAADVTDISYLELPKQDIYPYLGPHFHSHEDLQQVADANSKDRLLKVFAFRTATDIYGHEDKHYEFLILTTNRGDGTWKKIGYARVALEWWEERKKEPKTFILR